MTCSTQVRIHRSRVKLRGLSADGPLPRQTTMVNTQCHSTTTSSAPSGRPYMASCSQRLAIGQTLTCANRNGSSAKAVRVASYFRRSGRYNGVLLALGREHARQAGDDLLMAQILAASSSLHSSLDLPRGDADPAS